MQTFRLYRFVCHASLSHWLLASPWSDSWRTWTGHQTQSWYKMTLGPTDTVQQRIHHTKMVSHHVNTSRSNGKHVHSRMYRRHSDKIMRLDKSYGVLSEIVDLFVIILYDCLTCVKTRGVNINTRSTEKVAQWCSRIKFTCSFTEFEICSREDNEGMYWICWNYCKYI